MKFQVKFILDAWKSQQTINRSLGYLIYLFDNQLSGQPFATELRTKIKEHFNFLENGKSLTVDYVKTLMITSEIKKVYSTKISIFKFIDRSRRM